jgi:hypothetical protein
MELPLELFPIIFNNLSLSDIKSISSVCKLFCNIFNEFDWNTYIKHHNSLIPIGNKQFMIEQGKYILK